jgi:hypothetical protein
MAEKPVEGPRYALVLNKGKFDSLKLADLRLFDEKAQLYIGKYITTDGEATSLTDRDIPAANIVHRWASLPSRWEVDQAKNAAREKHGLPIQVGSGFIGNQRYERRCDRF